MTQPLTAKLALSISEAAQVLGVSDDLVYQLVARGQLPNLRLGRRRVIPIAALHALIDGCIDDCRGGAGK